MCEFEFISFIILLYISEANLLWLCKTIFLVCSPHNISFFDTVFSVLGGAELLNLLMMRWWPHFIHFAEVRIAWTMGRRVPALCPICSKALYVIYVALKSIFPVQWMWVRIVANLLWYHPGWWIRRVGISLGNIRFCKYCSACLYEQPILLMEACYRCS